MEFWGKTPAMNLFLSTDVMCSGPLGGPAEASPRLLANVNVRKNWFSILFSSVSSYLFLLNTTWASSKIVSVTISACGQSNV